MQVKCEQNTRRASAARYAISRRVFYFTRQQVVNYSKPPLSFDLQAELLVARGLEGDRQTIRDRLRSVSYYRLSGYLFPFRNPDDTFRAGTRFDTVWNRYSFDRRLRLLVLDAIERIEVAIRSQLSTHHSASFGPFGYALDPRSTPKLEPARRAALLDRIRSDVERSKEVFVSHFGSKYGDSHSDLPIWMATEVMSFGNVLTLYRGCPHHVKKLVASSFGVPAEVLASWLLTLNTVRNICAHHGRLWNRVLGVKPLIPRETEYPDWHRPVVVTNERVFAVLTICAHSLRMVAPQSGWSARLTALSREFPEIPLGEMGFPHDWAASPIWQPSRQT